jgi:DNA invertase Pin-like site-specific DNA recombinase
MEKAIIVARSLKNELKQDVIKQTSDLMSKYSSCYHIARIFAHHKSGMTNDNELKLVLDYAIRNDVQHILFGDVHRISPDPIEALTFIKRCIDKKINITIDNLSFATLNADKTATYLTNVILRFYSSFSDLELRKIRLRTKSKPKKNAKEGGKLGRDAGSKETAEFVLAKHKDVVRLLKKGDTYKAIMNATGKSSATILKVNRLLKNKTTGR